LIAYADTSFLVSLFARDALSATAITAAEAAPPFLVNPLHRAEFENAIGLCEFRRQLNAAEARAVRANFIRQLTAGVYLARPWPEGAWAAAENLSHRFAVRLGVRTLDVLHVAAALESDAPDFYTLDARQRRLARLAGLRCHP
jgi:hypothetical protein